jgi:regulator of sirC expression with transglutaminase-like and TPR domain
MADIDALALPLKARMPVDAAPLHRLRVLNRYFFHELGFAGNVNHFHDVGNSYVHHVLATRRGIPITLALIYIELAHAVSLRARGIAFPGHFLVKMRLSGGEAVIDPFTGRSLSREELEERLLPFRAAHGQGDDMDTPLGLYLQAATPRDTIARMLRNLKEIHATAQAWAKLLPVLDRLVVLLPHDWEERRDRGMAHAELGHVDDAIADLEHYLSARPGAIDAISVRWRLDDLLTRRRSKLH